MFRKWNAKESDGSFTAKDCISLLNTLQKDNDVKEILKALEKVYNIKIPRQQATTKDFELHGEQDWVASRIGNQVGRSNGGTI